MATLEFTRDTWPSDRWPNFTFDEFVCKHTGFCVVDPEFLDELQEIRTEFGWPMAVVSGYRHGTHPVEASKRRPGSHTAGVAADIRIHGVRAYHLLGLVLRRGAIRGIGIAQSGVLKDRYLHLDMAQGRTYAPRPFVWSY